MRSISVQREWGHCFGVGVEEGGRVHFGEGGRRTVGDLPRRGCHRMTLDRRSVCFCMPAFWREAKRAASCFFV